jgi:hypothetical protein
MPSKDQHYKKSKKNIDFYEDVVDTHPDWAVTGLFYAALHLVDAWLATRTLPDVQHPERHEFRVNLIGKLGELKPIYANYRMLQDYGHRARYKMDAFSKENVKDTRKTVFDPIQKEIDKLLGKL